MSDIVFTSPDSEHFPDKPGNDLSTFSHDKHKFILDRYPNLTWWVTDFTFPNITIPEIRISGPMGVNYNETGDSMTMTPLTVEFIIDEDFNTYREIFYWMQHMVGKRGAPHHLESETFGLLFLNTNMNNSNRAIKFGGVKPTDLTGITVSLAEDGSTVLKSSATFNVDWMDFVNVD